MRNDIQKEFGHLKKEQLLAVLSLIADLVDFAEDPNVIQNIQKLLKQEEH